MSDLKETTEGGSSRIKFWGGAVIVLMIILMFMPWNIGQRLHNQPHSVLSGTASGGRKVMSDEVRAAANSLEGLESLYVSIQTDPTNLEHAEDVPLLTALWGQERAAEMKRHPEAYFLLVEESKKFGLGESQRTLGSVDRDAQDPRQTGIFNSGTVYIRELHPIYGSPLYSAQHGELGVPQIYTHVFRPYIQNGTSLVPERRSVTTLPLLEQQSLYLSLRDLLSVQAAASLSQAAVKPSTLLIDQLMARAGQKFTLNVASIDARPFTDSVSLPTDAELKAQLEKYANTPSGPQSVSTENPFGFGYQIGDSVKFQMLSFSRAAVRAVVEAEKTQYDWEVEARMAYARDPKPFKPAPSATQPTTAPSKPEEVPPFDQIKADAVKLIIDKATDARVNEISRKLYSTLSLDYQAWLTAQPSSLGVSFESVDYLNKLASIIQSDPRFNVLPAVRSEQGKAMDLDALSLDPQLSRMIFRFQLNTARQLGLQMPIAPAPQYILRFAKPFMSKQNIEKAGSAVLEMYKPSETMSDFDGDLVAILRLTAAEKAHAATDLEPIRARLVADLNRIHAQEKAMSKAFAAIEAIKATGKFEVAGSAVSTVTVLPPQRDVPIPPELGPTADAYRQFHDEVGRNLLSGSAEQPVAAINVPLGQRVFVVQRTGLEPMWTSAEELSANRVGLMARIAENMTLPKSISPQFGVSEKPVGSEWLDVDSILARNEWVSVSGKEKDADAADAPADTRK